MKGLMTRNTHTPANHAESWRPLSALLSQVLVAYTVEFDNEFERRMAEAGYPGATVSLTVWHSLMRFLASNEARVNDLEKKAVAVLAPVNFQLGCLERWRFLTLQSDPTDARPVRRAMHHRAGRELRDGWGSGRGIRYDWIVRLTPKGQKAIVIWPGLFAEIHQRWQQRFGVEVIDGLRGALTEVAAQLHSSHPVAAAAEKVHTTANLPGLLAHLLLAFTREFDRQSQAPLWLCANTLRVLREKPVAEREIARLTGASSETSGIGWQVKPFIALAVDAKARRGKMLRLNARGLAAQAEYWKLVEKIEKGWDDRFGAQKIREVRERLEALFRLRDPDGSPLLAKGMIPPQGVKRAGEQTASLGARKVGVAARKRIKDLVAQTEEFVRDPVNALPHYPLWDMNRGFGP